MLSGIMQTYEVFQMQTLILTMTFIFGTILGSFFNVVIYRVPKKESIVYGSSHCPKCNTPLKPYELVPILSFLFLRGKCSTCYTPISWRYPLIEALTGVAYTLVVWRYGLTWMALIGVILASILIIIAMIDIDTMDIYDRFQVAILSLAIITIPLSGLPILDHLIGFFIIMFPFLIIAWLTGGMGGGDIKLAGVAGLLLGYKAMLVAFFVAAITGGIYGVYLLWIKHSSRKAMVAFGPFLCLGIFIAFLAGTALFEAYLALFA